MRTTEARRKLIERLDELASRSPDRYLRRVVALALLGLGVVALGFTVSLAASVGLVVALAAIKPTLLLHLAKVVWIPVATGWMLLRALWVKFEMPPGRLLRPGEVPALEAEVERLRAPSAAPPLDGIVISDELNAAAATVPRAMGLLGSRHYLVLGLPLMQSLDPEEFAAVVAHEFGHFSGRHGRVQGWIYQARASWYRILEALQQKQSRLLGAFVRFFDWYVPYFEAYSFVLARRQEYEADAMAARLVGPGPLASALARMEINAQRLAQEFWPSVDGAAARQPEPPADLHAAMAASLRAPDPDAGARLQAALSRSPGLEDTHPTLAQRIRSVGGEPGVPGPLRESAAEALLGPLLPELVEHFSGRWREAVADYWSRRHGEGRNAEARIAALRSKADPTPDEIAELALLRWELEPGTEAEAALRDAASRCPDHADLQLQAGKAMLSRGDAAGADALWRAIALEPDLADEALEHLASFHEARGDDAALDRVNEARKQEWARQQRARAARSTATASDTFVPHGLSGGQVAAAREAIRAHGKVRKAWIVRKALAPDLGRAPHYVVVVEWRGLVFSDRSALERLLEALELPGSYLAITAAGHGNVARRIRKVAGATVYP